jgi:hypothetical protein
MNTSDTPRYVVATPTAATRLLRHLRHAGWTVEEGFAPTATPAHGARIVRHGPVPDPRTADLVVRAAAAGAAVIALTDPTGPVGRSLVAGLRQLGPVVTGPAVGTGAAPTGQGTRLLPEQRALLDRLAEGETIAAAAAAEFLSLRTANRRIAAARQLLGVRTTREAVLVYLRQRGGR